MQRYLIAVLLVAAGTLTPALACEELLDVLRPQVELNTLEQRTTMTMTVDEEQVHSETYQAIDFEQRRLYFASDMPGMGEMVVVYQDGRATMRMPGMPQTMPAPPDVLPTLEQMFDEALIEGRLPQDVEVVSCDGVQSYAGLVTGEQVTVITAMPDMIGGELHAQETRFIFADGMLAASYTEVETLGRVLTIYDEVVLDEAGMLLYLASTNYQLENDVATPFSDGVVEVIAYNEPLDESLFAD